MKTKLRLKKRNVLVVIVLYLGLATLAWSHGGAGLLLLLLLYGAACLAGAKAMVDGAEARRWKGGAVEFAKSEALSALGKPCASFHYVFASKQDLTLPLLARMQSELRSKLGCSDLRETSFRDIDQDLPRPETREFRLAAAPDSARHTRFHFLCSVTRTLNVQGIRWWVLVLGERDPNRVLFWYAFSPATVPFVGLAYLQRQFEPLHCLTSVDNGFFNSLDVLARTREIEFVAYESLMDTLDAFGIDTSDLLAQRANILNVNVNGGASATLGSLVQGALNRISGTAAGVGATVARQR